MCVVYQITCPSSTKMSIVCTATCLHCPCSDAAVSDVADGRVFREDGPGQLWRPSVAELPRSGRAWSVVVDTAGPGRRLLGPPRLLRAWTRRQPEHWRASKRLVNVFLCISVFFWLEIQYAAAYTCIHFLHQFLLLLIGSGDKK